MRIARFLVLTITIAAPLRAQATAAPRQASRLFDAGVVAGADWLQANSLPFDRDALQSASFGIGLRYDGWSFDGGFLRIARNLSTVQGATLSAGRLLHLGPVQFIPAIGVLAGQASASRDSTGYDFVDAQGVVGHQTRYDYSDGFTFGGSVGLRVEYPVYRAIGVHLAAAQWFLSGAPLEGDRSRTVLGAGLSIRVMR